MKKRNFWLLATMFVLIGISSEAQASFLTKYFKFVNKTQSPIELKILTGFWCKNHQSDAIPPDGTWSCDTNCPYSATMEAFTLDQSQKRIVFGSILQLQSSLIGFCPGVCRTYVLSIFEGYNQIKCSCE